MFVKTCLTLISRHANKEDFKSSITIAPQNDGLVVRLRKLIVNILDVYKRQGQHEPLIDRMSFDIVQNKLKSRQRPGQTNEISLFAFV